MYKLLVDIEKYIKELIILNNINENNYTIEECIELLKDEILLKKLNNLFIDFDYINYKYISLYSNLLRDILECFCDKFNKKIIKDDLTKEYNNINYSSSLKIYFLDIEKYPILSREQQLELFLDYKNNNNQKSKDLLINSNQKLIVDYAYSKTVNEHILLDLIQEGNLAMLIALDKYDINKGVAFSTYSFWYIRRYINFAYGVSNHMVRKPHYLVELNNQIKKYIIDYNSINHCDPTEEQIKNKFNLTDERYKNAIRNDSCFSLNNFVTEEGTIELIDMIKEEDNFIENIELKKIYDLVMEEIEKIVSKENLEIIKKKLGLENYDPSSISDIARELNVSRQTIDVRYLKSMEKIKNNKRIKKLVK